jgi:hypothetical protein
MKKLNKVLNKIIIILNKSENMDIGLSGLSINNMHNLKMKY